METIQRHKVLQLIDSGEPFDLDFVTADRARGTGGKIKRVKGWQKYSEAGPVGGRPSDFKATGRKKTTTGSDHRTFNIYNPNDRKQHPVKVHYLLMAYFNNIKIV
ncbi:MAG: hypothetical protein ACTHMC_05260 [Pseudobacter sp.]|uniref:hypothetical protein n=1 Tax=Pseudobacter sp. TaxID=2045420 RepID=UPI003F80857F